MDRPFKEEEPAEDSTTWFGQKLYKYTKIIFFQAPIYVCFVYAEMNMTYPDLAFQPSINILIFE